MAARSIRVRMILRSSSGAGVIVHVEFTLYYKVKSEATIFLPGREADHVDY